jgi:hypothetical protein
MLRFLSIFLRTLGAVALFFVALIIVTGFVLSWMVKSSVDERAFLKGTVPDKPPVGRYLISAGGIFPSWRGKEFSTQPGIGMDLVENSGSFDRVNTFNVSMGPGLKDQISVIRMDYNRSGNPLWLRPVLQEMLQTSSGVYLGKIHVRLIPFLPFSIGYFKMNATQ